MPKHYTVENIREYLEENAIFFEVFVCKGVTLKPAESLIFWQIYNLTIKQERECFLSINQFVDSTHTTQKTVIKALKSLEAKQLIYIKRGFIDCGRPKNWYSINLDALGGYLYGDSVKNTVSVETTETMKKNFTTPSQNSHEVSVETTDSLCKNYREVSGETTLYNIKDTYIIHKENNNNDNHSEHGDFVASSAKADSVLDDKYSAAVYEIKKVYPRKIDEYDSEVLANTLRHIMNAYSLEELTTAAANYAKAMKNELPLWLMQASNFYGENRDGKRPFTEYLKKRGNG